MRNLIRALGCILLLGTALTIYYSPQEKEES